MSYTPVVESQKRADGPVVSDSLDTTGTNFGWVSAGWLASTASPTLTDNKGNTWTRRAIGTSDNQKGCIFDCVNPTVGTGHVLTLDNGGFLLGQMCIQFGYSSFGPLAFDDEATPTGAVDSTTLAAGPLTPNEDNCLVVAGLAFNGAEFDTAAIDDGFTLNVQQVVPRPGVTFGNAGAVLLQTTATAASPTWTITANADNNMVATLASYKLNVTDPVIIDVNGDDHLTANSTGNIINGLNFDTATVAIEQGAVSVAQTITAQSGSSITFTNVFDAGAGPHLKYGNAVLKVTNADDSEVTQNIVIDPELGTLYRDVVSPAA